jgi:hypothetical protein
MHPATKIEEYVDDIYHTGWLVFETEAGDEKRRLGRFPQRWASVSDAELQMLLARAERVQGRHADAERSPRDDRPPPSDLAPPESSADVNSPPQARTFRYPGGRYWTVALVVRADEADRPTLRFTAGARNIELGTWPEQWANFTDDQLVELLRWAAPRSDAGAGGEGSPRRRWDDRPELGR